MADKAEMAVPDTEAALAAARAAIAKHWGWFLALGIVFLLAGAAAIAFPLLSTIAAKVALGYIFLAIGILMVIHAFSITRWGGVLLNVLIGLLYAIAGGYLAFFPFTGIITLTLMLAALFLAEGILQVVLAIRLRKHSGWFWVLLSGIIAIAAGALIALELPDSATWAIGLLAGINMLSTGFSFIVLALAGRKAPTPAAPAAPAAPSPSPDAGPAAA